MIHKFHTSTVSVSLALLISWVIAPYAQAQPQNAQFESLPGVVKQTDRDDLITPVVSQLSPPMQKLIIRGPNNTFSISGEVADKKVVLKEIEQAFTAVGNRKRKLATQKQLAAPCIGPLCGYRSKTSYHRMNVLDSYVQVDNTLQFVGDAPDPFTVRAKIEGHQHSTWFGKKPLNADSVVVDAGIRVDGLSLSLSIPAEMGIFNRAPGYASQPLLNTWLASYSYSNLIVTSNFAITGLHQVCSGLFRFSSGTYMVITLVDF
jgi:hypothetical protein